MTIQVTVNSGPFSQIKRQGELVGWDGDLALVKIQGSSEIVKAHHTAVAGALLQPPSWNGQWLRRVPEGPWERHYREVLETQRLLDELRDEVCRLGNPYPAMTDWVPVLIPKALVDALGKNRFGIDKRKKKP